MGGGKNDSFLDKLISNRVTWHCGGMSDPFQPIEKTLKITEQLVDVTKEYGIHILFSTKSDNLYGSKVTPELHTFQLSVSNIDDRTDIEPNVPSIQSRINLFKELKQEGFKVGIRIQPFIPNVSGLDIIKAFEGADHFIVEGLKVVPQNKEQKEYIFNLFNLSPSIFTQKGLLTLLPEYRLKLYRPLIEYFESHNISYSISDNDLRRFSNNRCCCGDKLIDKFTSFNTTTMIKDFPNGYTKNNILERIERDSLGECLCYSLFTSNRTNGCRTVRDFYEERFNKQSSPFSPKFQYKENPTLFD